MKIEIVNFGQHESLELTTAEDGAALFVVGKNRAGKSTIRDAIEFALLGSCRIRGFPLKKDVATYMIREDADHACVTLNMGSWSVRRAITRSGQSRLGVQVSAIVGFVEFTENQFRERFIRAEPDAIRVALDAEQFYRMDDKARRKLLISVKDSERTTAEEVLAALGQSLTGYADEDAQRRENLTNVCETAVAIGFEQANARAIEYRRDGKRAVAALEGSACMSLAPQQVEGIDITVGEVWQHESKVEKIGAEVLEARRLLAWAEGGAEEKLKALRDRLGALRVEQSKAKLQISLEDGRSIEGDEAIAFLVEQREESLAAQTKCLEHIASNLQKMQELEDERADLETGATVGGEPPEGSPAQCPAVSFKMKCPAKPQTFAKAFEKSELSTVGEGARTLEDIDGEIMERVTQQQKSNKYLEDERDGYASFEKKQQMIEAGAVIHARVNSEASETAEAIRVAEEEESAVQSGNATREELEFMEERLRVGTLVTTARKEWDRAQLEREKIGEAIAAAKLEVSWWDEVEKQLRPDGIESSLAELATGGFASALEACDTLARVRVTDDMTMSINGRHIASCSKSEQLCGGIALQAAMSSMIGLPILVVDEVDKLDGEWKRVLTEWIGELRTSTFPGGVVALATSDADPPRCPPDRFVTAWLRPGRPTLHLGASFEESLTP